MEKQALNFKQKVGGLVWMVDVFRKKTPGILDSLTRDDVIGFYSNELDRL